CLVLLVACSSLLANAQDKNRWSIGQENRIIFDATDTALLPYKDNIEMSGNRVAAIVSYEIDKRGELTLSREVFFPQLHQYKPTSSSVFFDYRAYLQDEYSDDLLPKVYLNDGQFLPGAVEKIVINGTLNFEHKPSVEGVVLKRELFPSMSERSFEERWTLINTTTKSIALKCGNTTLELEDFGKKGKFVRRVISDAPSHYTLNSGDSVSFSLRIMAKIEGESFPMLTSKESLEGRKEYINTVTSSLVLETPSEEINTLFEFSKIRGAESIYESKLGLIHSPGGGRYYVGIWANDQAEYISPFFPYLGYDQGVESAINCYRAFAKEINPEYSALRYSFEVEDLPAFYRDRGDAAMIAYGATHFLLANSDVEIAKELWPLVEWCLEYCHRQLNSDGVVKSDTDEMEGRIATGDANLSTSALYYGALNHAIYLAQALGVDKSLISDYKTNMKALKVAIESYFGSNIEGLDTYKYYKEHTALRHWICMPLVVGIFDRKDATITALFDHLWSDNGVHVERNNPNKSVSEIFWDRGTLYALRGAFYAGETEKSYERLIQFTQQRLLGDRVPYVVEAAPEGQMAHLSAESGLYCRIFTEGILGLEPLGFNSFRLKPQLPKEWDFISLRNIKAYGGEFDIEVKRQGERLSVVILHGGKVVSNKRVKEGESLTIKL
ncbi:MAG: six-hairpin glycosidase-like protein, partial [Rikenellaceae bacterium]